MLCYMYAAYLLYSIQGFKEHRERHRRIKIYQTKERHPFKQGQVISCHYHCTNHIEPVFCWGICFDIVQGLPV